MFRETYKYLEGARRAWRKEYDTNKACVLLGTLGGSVSWVIKIVAGFLP
jgi:hypothetical protein